MRSTMIVGIVYVCRLFCVKCEKRGCVGNTSHYLSYGVGMSGAKQGAQQESGEAAQ